MSAFYDVLVVPLAEKSKGSASAALFDKLRANTQQVLLVAQQLLKDMEAAYAAGTFASSVGGILYAYAPMLKAYRDYVTLHKTVQDDFNARLRSDKRFRTYVASLTSKRDAAERCRVPVRSPAMDQAQARLALLEAEHAHVLF